MKIGLSSILSTVFAISNKMDLRKYNRVMSAFSLVTDFLQSGGVDLSKVAGLSGLIPVNNILNNVFNVRFNQTNTPQAMTDKRSAVRNKEVIKTYKQQERKQKREHQRAMDNISYQQQLFNSRKGV